MDEISRANSRAWDKEEETGSWWSKIVDESLIAKAREGNLELRITTERTVPESWSKMLKDKSVLVLCGGGGQQTPLIAAYGGDVTSIDISENQIEKDREALSRYSLKAKTIVGDVLSLPFEDESFDAVVNPISLNFVSDLNKAYSEIDRVLKKGGVFMMGIANPVLYIFDEKKMEKKLKVKYTLPFSADKSLSEREYKKRIERNDTIEFSHTLESIITPLLRRGFVIEDFFTDRALSEPTDSYISDAFLSFLFVKGR